MAGGRTASGRKAVQEGYRRTEMKAEDGYRRKAVGRRAAQDGYRRTEIGTEDGRIADTCMSGLTQSFLRSPPDGVLPGAAPPGAALPDGVPPASAFLRSSFDPRHQRRDLSRQTGSVFSYFLRNVRIEQSYVFGQIKLRPHFTGRTTRYP